MKKYFLGIFAILLALAFSAFTSKHKAAHTSMTNLYWFNVPGSIANNSTLTNSDVTYLNADQPSDPSPGDCTGTTNYCHVGFSDNQVIVNGSNVTLNGTQTPVSFDSKP